MNLRRRVARVTSEPVPVESPTVESPRGETRKQRFARRLKQDPSRLLAHHEKDAERKRRKYWDNKEKRENSYLLRTLYREKMAAKQRNTGTKGNKKRNVKTRTNV